MLGGDGGELRLSGDGEREVCCCWISAKGLGCCGREVERGGKVIVAAAGEIGDAD
jgi:hypothetical protein